MLPEIIFFTKLKDTIRRYAYLVVPDLKRLVIVHIYRRIQAVRIKTDYLCKEFPCPLDRFLFEIVSKRKVSEHFKECTVTCGLSHIFDIARTDTFLAGCHPLSRRDLLSCKIWF